ncbi:N-acetylmuramoyl-L-alanine amidase [uncultured Tolumonas sp.]|uniref:N-acetylmuramoyl-L-alanine amidase n=1 Tax=uncultured Tolumonas sp. TaxID=263765 RepID=UPI002A0A6CF0|nr:N-acetylmuramoyl-L-alanine amidase [uncultured Tolumonas sp.]
MKIRILLILLAVLAWPAAANQIKQLRISPTEGKVRMVFDLESQPNYSFTIDTGKNSLIIAFQDITGTPFPVPRTAGCEGFLRSIRRNSLPGNVVQVEFALANGVKPQIFSLAPQANYRHHRLVIDIKPGTLIAKNGISGNSTGSPVSAPDPASTKTKDVPPVTVVSRNELTSPAITVKTETTQTPVATSNSNNAVLQAQPPTAKIDKAVAGRVIQFSDLISKEELAASDSSPAADEPDNSPDTSKVVLPSNGGPFIVAIDAGHGGKDPGAIGPGHTYEKTVTLGIARKLANLINNQPGMRAIMTRSRDNFVELDERSAIARRKNARLLISIHADSGPSNTVRGASVWILSAKRVDKEMDKLLDQQSKHTELLGGAGKVIAETEPNPYLAQTILDLSWDNSRSEGYDIGRRVLRRIGNVATLHKKRPEHASLAVLKAPDIPSLLIETGFISNPQEERLLASADYQSQLANAIFSGVRDYYGRNLPSGGGTLVNSSSKKNGTSANAAESDSHKHVVKTGESLSGLAEQYRVSKKALRNRNKLKSDNLLIGQVIIIPTI